MPVPDIVIDTLAKLPGVSYVCVLERDSRTILGASGNADSGLPAEEIVDAFDSAAGVGGTRGGAVQTVVVTGSRVVQVLAPVPLADDSAGVLYLRLARARANLASALREVESVTGGRARRSTGQPGVGALPSAAGASARRTAVPSALPGPASGTSTPPRGVPAASRTGGSSASPSAARPAAATRPALTSLPATPPPLTPLPSTPSAPPAPSAPPPSTPAALPAAALLAAPRPAPPTPGPSSAQLEHRAEGAVATDPSPAAVTSTPTAFAPEPRAPADKLEEPQVRSRSSYLAAEFFAAAHRARPPLPPDPAPRPVPPAGQPRGSRGADSGGAQRRGERDPRPGPPTERLSAPGIAGPRHRVPGPRPAPDDPAGATVPGAAPERAAPPSSAPSSADERPAGPADDERSPAGADATAADRPVDPHEHAADGTRSGSSDDAATAPPDALPRRRGDTVIPPPREPEDADQERRWATDLHTLRRLADGLRRRLR